MIWFPFHGAAVSAQTGIVDKISDRQDEYAQDFVSFTKIYFSSNVLVNTKQHN